jgi:hypothetical protein
MKTVNLLLLLALVMLLPCCKSDSTGPSTTDAFSVNITVKNAAGNTVPGLRISWWNKLPASITGVAASKTGTVKTTLSVSTIEYAAPSAAYVTLAVFDWNHSQVASLVDHELKAGGIYRVDWSINLAKPTRAFYYRIVAQDTGTGAAIFRDSLFAMLWQPDRSISVGGWTSSSGIFHTSDSLLFPNVLSLPTLIYTTDNPETVSTFTLSDTLIIALTDTATQKYETYQKVVKKGVANEIQLTWNPAAAKESTRPVTPARKPATTMDIVPGTGPTHWRLYQNYPNPFN